MARRLALLALLACAVLANPTRPPLSVPDTSDSFDLVLWDDYEESLEKSFPSRHATVKPIQTKMSIKIPTLNVTNKNTKSGEKNNVIKTTINISSYTNIIVTKRPPNVSSGTRAPQEIYVDVNSNHNGNTLLESVGHLVNSSTKKPVKLRTKTTTRRPLKTSRPRITATTRRTRATTRTTRRSTTKSIRATRTTPRTTKVSKTKVPCSIQKNTGWISSYFEDNKIKKSPKKEEKSGWFVGRLIVIFNS